MKNLVATYAKSNEYLRAYNKVRKVSFFKTVCYMLGGCALVGGHGYTI